MPPNDLGRRPNPNAIRESKIERYERALDEIIALPKQTGESDTPGLAKSPWRIIAEKARKE